MNLIQLLVANTRYRIVDNVAIAQTILTDAEYRSALQAISALPPIELPDAPVDNSPAPLAGDHTPVTGYTEITASIPTPTPTHGADHE